MGCGRARVAHSCCIPALASSRTEPLIPPPPCRPPLPLSALRCRLAHPGDAAKAAQQSEAGGDVEGQIQLQALALGGLVVAEVVGAWRSEGKRWGGAGPVVLAFRE